jgi:hypothetical protein
MTSLEAKARHGATVRLGLKNGIQARGELLAVRKEALIVRDLSGPETSYEVGEIASVTVVGKTKRFPAGFVGFALGAAAGYALGANPRGWPHEDDFRVLNGVGKGILLGAFGAIVGTIATAGRDRGRETVYPIEGLSDEQVRVTLARLRGFAKVLD